MNRVAGFLAVAIACAGLPGPARAEAHLVPSTAIDRTLGEAAAARAADTARVDALLARPEAAEAARRLGVSPETVRAAAARLSEAERSDLLQRAEQLTADPAAGLDSDIHQLLVILLIVVIVVVLLDAVK